MDFLEDNYPEEDVMNQPYVHNNTNINPEFSEDSNMEPLKQAILTQGTINNSKFKGCSKNAGKFLSVKFLQFLKEKKEYGLHAELSMRWGGTHKEKSKSYYYFKESVVSLPFMLKLDFYLYFQMWVNFSLEKDLSESHIEKKNQYAYLKKIMKWKNDIWEET